MSLGSSGPPQRVLTVPQVAACHLPAPARSQLSLNRGRCPPPCINVVSKGRWVGEFDAVCASVSPPLPVHGRACMGLRAAAPPVCTHSVPRHWLVHINDDIHRVSTNSGATVSLGRGLLARASPARPSSACRRCLPIKAAVVDFTRDDALSGNKPLYEAFSYGGALCHACAWSKSQHVLLFLSGRRIMMIRLFRFAPKPSVNGGCRHHRQSGMLQCVLAAMVSYEPSNLPTAWPMPGVYVDQFLRRGAAAVSNCGISTVETCTL